MLVVAHGSPRKDNEAMERHASELSGTIGVPVHCAYRRYSDKRVRPAMESLADEGFRNVAVIPAFLSENMYSVSIPRAMGLRTTDRTGTYVRNDAEVSYTVTDPIGCDPLAPEAIAEAASSYPGYGAVLVGKHPDTEPRNVLETRSLEILSERGIPSAWCNDPGDPEAGMRAMASIGCDKAVFIPVSFTRRVAFGFEGSVFMDPFGTWSCIPGIMKSILDRTFGS